MGAHPEPEDRLERWIDLAAQAASGVVVPLVRDALVPLLRVLAWVAVIAYFAARNGVVAPLL